MPAKKSKQCQDGCALEPGDEVCGCFTDADGCEQHIHGIVHCVTDSGDVKVMYTHLHCDTVDPANLKKVN